VGSSAIFALYQKRRNQLTAELLFTKKDNFQFLSYQFFFNSINNNDKKIFSYNNNCEKNHCTETMSAFAIIVLSKSRYWL